VEPLITSRRTTLVFLQKHHTRGVTTKIGNNLHVDTSIYTTPHTNTKFSWNQLLNVPAISMNLLGVSKFACDNQVFFEFYSDHCLVKQQETKAIMLHGKLKDELYVFENFVPSNDYTDNIAFKVFIYLMAQ